jgi:hypothetical protein
MHADLVEHVAHVYLGSKEGHRADAECPCRPSTPLTSRPGDPAADLYVHRFLRADLIQRVRDRQRVTLR